MSQSAKTPTIRNLRVGAKPAARQRAGSPILPTRCISFREGPRVLATAPHAAPCSPPYLGHSPRCAYCEGLSARALQPQTDTVGEIGWHPLRGSEMFLFIFQLIVVNCYSFRSPT